MDDPEHTGGATTTFRIPKGFNEDLNKVLTPLLGTSIITTNANEFNLKHSLKLRLLNSAVSTIERESNDSNDENKARVQAAIEVIRSLITYNNPYEFNRVLRQQSDFYDCLDHLILKTKFVAILEQIFARDMPAYESTNEGVNHFFNSAIECLLVVIDYIDLKKDQLK
jgi:hypothetical protein